MKEGIKIGIIGDLVALGLFGAVYICVRIYWMERDNYEKQEIDHHYKSASYYLSIFYLSLAVFLSLAAICALMLFTYIFYDTAKTKWLRRKRLRVLGLEFERRMNFHSLSRAQRAGDEQFVDEEDANEQFADEEYAIEQVADEDANEQFADDEDANEQFADEEDPNEQVADEEDANEQFADEEHNV